MNNFYGYSGGIKIRIYDNADEYESCVIVDFPRNKGETREIIIGVYSKVAVYAGNKFHKEITNKLHKGKEYSFSPSY